MSETSGQKTHLVMPDEEALARVSGHIRTGKQLLEAQVSNADELRDIKARYRKWREYGIQLLKNIFSDDSVAERLQGGGGIVYTGPDFEGRYQQFRSDFLQDITTLESIEETLPIMPRKPRDTSPKPMQQEAPGPVTQNFHGHVSNVIGSNSGQASQGSTTQAGSSGGGKMWQLFLALLGIAGVIAAAYIAYRMHWM